MATKELNKFILNGEEISVADSSARATAEEAESLANVANAKAEAVDAELTRQVGILDNKIESVDDKADNYYNTLDQKIDSQGDTLEGMLDNLNDTLTLKINDQGVPPGGTDGQILAKDGSTNYQTKWVTQAQPTPVESEIDDSITASNRTWSSSKISTELSSVGSNILDDATTTNNKTWSSSKIASEISGSVISEIDDTVTASNKTWSSQKINSVDSNILTKIESTQEITAGINSAGTAEKTYSAGDYLIRNDILYKATTNIAQGATLTVGVNIEGTDVASELNAMKGLNNMIKLDYANPVYTFPTSGGRYTYTPSVDCYLVGTHTLPTATSQNFEIAIDNVNIYASKEVRTSIINWSEPIYIPSGSVVKMSNDAGLIPNITLLKEV